jgi:hypothetical protein
MSFILLFLLSPQDEKGSFLLLRIITPRGVTNQYCSVKPKTLVETAWEQVAGSRERIEKLIILFLISKLTDHYRLL